MIPDVKHRELIMEFAQAAGVTQAKNVAGLGMLMQLTQGGAILNVASGRPGAVRMAASVVIPTEWLARLMTNKHTVKLMTSAAKTPVEAKLAPAIATKLAIAYENAKKEEEGSNTAADDVLEYADKKLSAL